MYQHLSNSNNEEPEHLDRSVNEDKNRPRYNGFEGMNYEQPRQPYYPRTTRTPRGRSGKEPGSAEENNTSPV